MKLGFIGFGEVGFEMSKGFKGAGVETILAYDVMQAKPVYGELVAERAASAGVTLVASPAEMLGRVDVVMAAVPGSKALETAKGISSYLSRGTLYVDVSASSPEVKKAIGEEMKAAAVLFVDAAMLGSLPVHQHRVPTLISGNGSDRLLQIMAPYGMDLEKISDVPGDATAIKLVRSIFMKGLPALLTEVLQAASVMKVEQLVIESLASTMNATPFEQTLNRLVTANAVHAERRSYEMKSSIEMLESIGVTPTMSRATHDKLVWLAAKGLKEKFGGKPPKEWPAVIDALEQNGGQERP